MINNNHDPADFFITPDIWLVAYLLASGEKYIAVDRRVENGKHKVYFLFSPEVEERVHDYFNQATIPAILLKNSVENVKNILFDI